MYGSSPEAALAGIFSAWHMYEAFDRFKEYRKNNQVNSNSSKRKGSKRKSRFNMGKFSLFMSTASMLYAVVHVAEAG